jgi:hypothetical protein
MTTVSAGRSTRSRRRVHPAVGTTAPPWSLWLQSVSAHRSLVSPRRLARPRCTAPGLTSAHGPGAEPLLPHDLDPRASYGPAMWNSGMPPGPVASTHTGGDV